MTADQYPYVAGATALAAKAFRPQGHEGALKLIERLKDPATRETEKGDARADK